jgi:hypothetical protein
MQMQPMVTVKRAAALLGIDKSVLRQRVSEGSLKGERRMIGSKEKWFLYCGELDALLDQRFADPSERAERVSLSGMTELFDAGQVVPIDGTDAEDDTPAETTAEAQDIQKPRKKSRKKTADHTGNPEADAAVTPELADDQSADPSLDFTPSVPSKMLTESQLPQELFQVEGVLESQSSIPEMPGLEGIVRCLTIEFAYRLAEERQTICKLQDQLEEKDVILRRIPLLEKSLHDASSGDADKQLELSNLRAHVAILENQVQRLKQPWWQRVNRWLQGT